MTGAEQPSRRLDPLEAVRTPAQEAGSQLAAALRACDELTAGPPEVADIRQWLTEAARLIGRAEVLSYPLRWGLRGLALERSESEDVALRARWRVVDEAGVLVGLVIEDRDRLSHALGPPTFIVAHNPTGGEGEPWVSSDHPSPMVALAALVDHLERR